MHFKRCYKSVVTAAISIATIILLFAIAPGVALASDNGGSCNHSWTSWYVDEDPTPYEKGLRSRYCEICGREEVQSIPKRKMNKSERQAVKLVNTYLKAAKRYDWKKMNRCFAKTSKKYGYPTTNTAVKYYKKYNKRMLKWKITHVEGSGKTYHVYAKVKYPNGYKLMYNSIYGPLVNCFEKHFKRGTLNTRTAQREAQRIGEQSVSKYYAKLRSPGIKRRVTEEIDFTVVKRNGKWKLKKKSREIVDIACCDYNAAVEDAFDNYESYVSEYLEEYYGY